ncbi:MAG TPA: DUF222 domain-containing protein [Actinomycetota bacterium]|jgi:hypothetical protein
MFDANHREAADAAHVALGRAHRDLLAALVAIDRSAGWVADGARDCAHWVQMRYGISLWKAERWVRAAHELETLPAIADALATGLLSIDKVAELTRFANFDDEDGLVRWARGVPAGAIRHRADVERRRDALEAELADRARSLTWRYEDDRFEMHAELPTADGEAVREAIERMVERIPAMPGEDGDADARRADALVALCRSGGSAEGELRPATVVVHARLDGLVEGTHGCETEQGPALAPTVVERLVCNARMQTVVEDARGEVVRVGRLRREPPAWMLRQLRYRDRGCVFPGCGTRSFTEAHHVVWWSKGGPTDLENLVVICSFHHRLVHEHGWGLSRAPEGEVRWFRANGERYLAGPSPGDTEPRRTASA